MIYNGDNYDLVIAGGGLAGNAAAVEAADHGLKTLVVEKADILGGKGNYVEGPGAIESKMEKEAGIEFDLEKVMDYMMSSTHYRASEAHMRQFLKESGPTMDWVVEKGGKFDKVGPAGESWPVIHDFSNDAGYDTLHKGFIPYAKARGVEYLTGVQANNLVLDDKGHVSGIKLEKVTTGEKQTIHTKNVIVSTGGYFDNPEMTEKYTQMQSSEQRLLVHVSTGKCTGEGIRMSWKAGARKYLRTYIELGAPYIKDKTVPAFAYFRSHLQEAASQEALLWVNAQGERFVREDVTDNLENTAESGLTQTRIFGILSQDQIDYLNDKGMYKVIGNSPVSFDKLANLKDELKQFKNKKFLTKADTIEELQEKLGLPHLAETIKRYNELCAKGHDDDFFKNPKYLHALNNGPFYAVEMGVAATDSVGGLKVSLKNEVLNDREYPIPGLYAAGVDGIGVLEGDSYPQKFQGITSAYALFSGRNAAKSVAESLKK